VNELYVRKMDIIKLMYIMLRFCECRLLYFEQIKIFLFVQLNGRMLGTLVSMAYISVHFATFRKFYV
jgi:hypothetical protein